MNNNIKNALKNINNTDVMEQFFTLLELPDNQFNTIYVKLKNDLAQTFDSSFMRKNLIEQLKTMPQIDIEKEFKEVQSILDDIKNDKDLSDNKKEILTMLIEGTENIIRSVIKNPREIIPVKIQKINKNAILPTYAHDSDSGADIYAIEDIEIEPYTTTLIKTGLKVGIPLGYEIQIRPRSGLSLKTKLRLSNTPGTIDSNYRGEIGIIIDNIGDTSINISKGDKIAQMIIMPVPMIKWEEVEELNTTDRGEGGFGSTDQE